MVIIVNFIIILISLFLGIINVQAHDANIKGYKEKNTEHVSACGGKYYGYHKKNGTNHWHEVEYSKGKWIIVDSKKSYKTDPCQKEIKKRVLLKNCVDGDTAVFVVDKEELKLLNPTSLRIDSFLKSFVRVKVLENVLLKSVKSSESESKRIVEGSII